MPGIASSASSEVGPPFRDVQQRRVVEHDVGRDLSLDRELLAQRFQPREQLVHLRGAFRRPPRRPWPPRRRLCWARGRCPRSTSKSAQTSHDVSHTAIGSPKWRAIRRWRHSPAAARLCMRADLNVLARRLVAAAELGGEAIARQHVGPRIEQHAVAGQPVAAGAADLLVVALDRARHVAVDHVADVRLVDAHAERDGRDHHLDLVARERVLDRVARARLHAGVVGGGAHALAPAARRPAPRTPCARWRR